MPQQQGARSDLTQGSGINVDELLKSLLGDMTGLAAYGSVFGILLVCGLGVPLPEDISLILGGYLVHRGAARLPAMLLVGFGGILAGDSLIFLAGRRFGAKVGVNPGGLLGKVITPAKRAQVATMFARHGQKIVMIARFLPGVRAVTYFTAGSIGMSFGRFIFFDGLAAALSAPIFVLLGYRFGGELELLIERLKQGQIKVIAGLVASVGIYLLVKWFRTRRKKREVEATLGSGATLPHVTSIASGERVSSGAPPDKGATGMRAAD